MNKFILDII